MASTVEGIRAVNSFVRTMLLVGGLAIVGWGGWLGYSQFIVPAMQSRAALAQVDTLKTELAQVHSELTSTKQSLANVQRDNERLQTALKLLKIDRRLAHVTVLATGTDERDEPFMDVSFVEVDASGKSVGLAQPYRLRGEQFYLDCWTVKFDDRYVEAADLLRGASLCVFKRIWGDLDGPAGGHSLDALTQAGNQPPGIYQESDDVTEFERKIWQDFWIVANDPKRQRELGIRANHGEVVYVAGETGRTYQVELRSSGGLSLIPLSE